MLFEFSFVADSRTQSPGFNPWQGKRDFVSQTFNLVWFSFVHNVSRNLSLARQNGFIVLDLLFDTVKGSAVNNDINFVHVGEPCRGATVDIAHFGFTHFLIG